MICLRTRRTARFSSAARDASRTLARQYVGKLVEASKRSARRRSRSGEALVHLHVLTGPSLRLAQALLYGYMLSRLLHFAAYLTAQTHEVRATFWTIGSVILIFISRKTLLVALGY